MKEAAEICNLIKLHKAHIYVCGDVQMAENVYQTLRWAYKTIRAKSEKKVVNGKFLMQENNCDCWEAIRVGCGEVYAAAKGNAFSALEDLQRTEFEFIIFFHSSLLCLYRMRIAITKTFSASHYERRKFTTSLAKQPKLRWNLSRSCSLKARSHRNLILKKHRSHSQTKGILFLQCNMLHIHHHIWSRQVFLNKFEL